MSHNDFVIPFSLFGYSQKGRLVVLEEEMQKILAKHQYPEVVNRFIVELMAILTVMASDTKTKSIVSLQINADAESAISLLVADLESDGGMRAYARFDAEKVKQISDASTLKDIFKNGYMVLTIDFENEKDRYQAIVELSGGTLSECMEHYCHQSDQIPTTISVYIAPDIQKGRLATAMMVQQLPISSNSLMHEREEKIEQWSTVLHFLRTLKSEEALLTEPKIILYRLFHDIDHATATLKKLTFKCRCSFEKVQTVIKAFSEDEKKSLMVDGYILANCEFCGAEYKLQSSDVE